MGTRRPSESEGEAIADAAARLGEVALRDLVIAAAERHPDAAQALRLAAAGPASRLVVLRAMVDESLRTRRFLDWRESSEWAAEAQPVVHALAREVSTESSRELVELLERAVGNVVKVILRVDDSNGSVGDLARELLDLHAQACDSGEADPVRLSKWLIRFTFDDQDFFNPDPVRYQSALGDKGLAVYRREVHRRTTAEPVPFAAVRAQERLAVLDRDSGRIIELMGGDQTRPHQFIAVAEAMLELGLDDDALAWARRGIVETTGWQVAKLFDIACSIHDRRDEPHAVLGLRRDQLTAMPSSACYRLLRGAAERVERWDEERPAARSILASNDTGELVDALLADGHLDEAWATAQGTIGWEPGERRRLQLAQAREASAPGEAVGAYVALVDIILETTDRRAYERAVRHLKAARRAAVAADVSPLFDAQIARLREEHRRRPTLIALLDKADLG